MHRPPKGDLFRRGNSNNMMFQPSAQDTPNMSIKINEGSFWLNGTTFVEYGGGSSPEIPIPSSGAKWVLVVINKLGTINILNGKVAMNNPELPAVSRNVMPIAAVYIKSSTKVITTDMIYDVRPTLAAGGYPLSHNQLADKSAPNAHTIDSITDLPQTLEDKVGRKELNDILSTKADTDGTVSAKFVLNKDDTGVPVEYCGLEVNRGSMPSVGVRYNEDADHWQYTNDGSVWHNFGEVLNSTENANSYTAGLVKTSVDPSEPENPVVVAVNDPAFLSISEKADKNELLDYYKKEETDQMLLQKIDAEAVYSKADAENIFVTKAEFAATGAYSKSEINDMLNVKANKAETYTKTETDSKLSEYYTKEETDEAIARIAGQGTDILNIYTKPEIDTMFESLENTVYTKSEVENMLSNKADKENVYTKDEVDAKISGTGEDGNIYTKAEVNALLDNKATVNHTHSAHESIIQDECHRFVSDEEITKWNNKLDSFEYTPEDASNKGIANGYASLDASGKVPVSQLPAAVISGGSGIAFIVNTYDELGSVEGLEAGMKVFVVDASGDSTVNSGWAEYIFDQNNNFVKIAEGESMDAIIDWENIQNKPSEFKASAESLAPYALSEDVYTKLQTDNLLADKASSDHVHSDVYTKAETDALLEGFAKTSDIHEANVLGTVTVDETGMADGRVLAYNAAANKLEYRTVSAEGAVDTGMVGTKTVDETNMTGGQVLSYDADSDVLVYRNMDTVNGVQVDNTDIAEGKTLVYDGEQLVYRNMPDIPEIDDTDIADGKALVYDASENKLVYGDVSGSGSSGDSFVTFAPIGTPTDDVYGPLCKVTASSNNVTFTKNGLNVGITPGENVKLVSAVVKFTEDELTETSNTVTIDFNTTLSNNYADMYVPQVQVFRGEPGGGNMSYYSNARFNLNTNAHTLEFTALPSDGFTIRITY